MYLHRGLLLHHLSTQFFNVMMKVARIAIINLAVFSGIIASIEISLNIAWYFEHRNKNLPPVGSDEVRTGQIIPFPWEQVFHPGVGHSHQKSEFIANLNTMNLIHDNISATEVFKGQDNPTSEFRILTLGGSTTDPLGTSVSGYRGTWVHHLFEGIAKSNSSRYIVDNAGNGGSTSSNELLRLITKLHSNHYDLIISFNGINEIYFVDDYHYKDKENILASQMLMQAMQQGIIKGLNGKTYFSPLGPLRNTKLFFMLSNVRSKLSEVKAKFAGRSQQFTGLSKQEKDMVVYGANIWSKNIDIMNATSLAMNAKYLAVLQPTLGLGGNYCTTLRKECMLTDSRYIAKMNYLYSLLRRHCSSKDYCLDISSDRDLTSSDSLYTDPRHPNSKGNMKIAGLMRERVVQSLDD